MIGPPDDLTYRPVRADELVACTEIWRTSINDYIGRLGQRPIETTEAPLLRLYAHLLATDPDRFIVAVQTSPETSTERVVAFAAALRRERLWFLSALFVERALQGRGVGRALLARVMPAAEGAGRVGGAADTGVADRVSMATATDSAQPISNALYSSYGIVPKVPLLNLIGRPERPAAFDPLPSGITPVAFDAIAAGPSGAAGHRELTEAVDALDRDALGVAHPIDHRFLRSETRHGWLYRGPDGAPLGYGYAGEAGRVGPVAVRDAALIAPILGHLTTVVEPRGAFAIWIPGLADRALSAALHAGFHLDPFPILLCWDHDFADFGRYLPISPGLL